MAKMTEVESSLIESIGYDDAKHELFVKFRGKGLYIYANVPASVYDDLISAPSYGSFFIRNIKGTYPAKKASDYA